MSNNSVLFLQHAADLGGSALSVLYTAQGLAQRGYKVKIALLRNAPAVKALYMENRIETFDAPGIGTFEHSTADWASLRRPLSLVRFARARLRAGRSAQQTLELVERIGAGIVHLNSIVLVDSARALIGRRTHFVWHVREAPVLNSRGWRNQYIRQLLLSTFAHPVFLSDTDQKRWCGTVKGVVIPNFVDSSRFKVAALPSRIRSEYGIAADKKAILYLGGVHQIKGWNVLMTALHMIASRGLDFVCIMPGTQYVTARSVVGKIARILLPLVGSGAPMQRFDKVLGELGLTNRIVRLPWVQDVAQLHAAADFVVFPSIRPHFARPVMEAAVIGRPSIASDLPGMQEMIVDGVTGLLVPPGDPVALGNAIEAFLSDSTLLTRMGRAAAGFSRERFSRDEMLGRLVDLYENVRHRNVVRG